MSDIFSKQPQPAFQRWEMKSFGDNRPSTLAARQAQQEEEERLAREQAALAEAQAAEEAAMYAEPEQHPDYPTEEELDAIREEARQQGYEAGYAAGHADGQAQALDEAREATAKTLEPVAEIAGNFSTALREADQLIANEVLELALHLAKGMLKTALPAKPELILPIVRDAIQYLPVLQPPAILALNPEDAQVVRDGLGEELEKDGWSVIEDPSIGRGGCKIDTASNQIDAQAASRWQRLTHALGKDLNWLD
ncbi:flagellar assembly protein FliH [Massilia violacea]|uniref:Flagellar assembly protein FliH n=2 Tax=Pseudoduganella violacea TaxID=1715466 RepID=A0A7W5B733_9BURK|nr:flagellar assembly protein FliH [Pseudoduganella violacea]MBB3117744.1 flagellar assembly protein FliH [Pseudoduganella violacea]